jgi:hypothetical protein
MKRFAIVLFCLVFSAQTMAQKYAIRSGYVEYELSGTTKGTKKIWWDDYGAKSRTEEKSVSETKVFGMVSRDEKHQIDIISGADIYSYNPANKSGTKSKNPYGDLGKAIMEQLTEQEQKELAEQILQSLGGSIIGTETILGKKCDIVEVMGSKSWIYKGILLKSDARVMMIQNIQTAVSFRENEKVPSSKFIPDAGVQFQDLTALEQGYLSGNDYADDDSDDADEDPIVPVNYPFDKFQNAISQVNIEGYNRLMVINEDGQYIATYMKGFGNIIAVILSSNQNQEPISGLESFRDGGKNCHFGIVEDDGSEASVLIVEYPQNDMVLMISAKSMGTPQLSKPQMLSFARQIKL